ncbi:uncharacterized protein LOC102625559 isoform X3 [Citrus sinensis]|uniref:uncharacterized protein LOC102625559 isoform X3 n=1 Tax=Citrus sinensis TaxID=2711 RepID=UPI0022797CC7|nr:uncharacterized protein LOC102625559 isoform X3 [Citrus sinensis]
MAMATTSTSNTETTKVKLKLMIDKRANKVLFAEAEKDFVDILFNVLYMPFGSVARLLTDAGFGGCIGNLNQSLENLTDEHLIHDQTKAELLKPLSKWGKASLLLQPQACPGPVPGKRKLYICGNHHPYVTNEENTRCPQCTQPSAFGSVNSAMNIMNYEVQQLNIVSDTDGGVVKKAFAYMVTDDLSVTPASVISATGLLQGKIKDIGALEERVVDIGPDEVLELLNASMQTNEALTTVFLPYEEKVYGLKMI